MPKRYILFKWIVYSLAVLLLILLQLFVLNRISILGVIPFLAPMVTGTVASLEGSRASPIFALVFGLLCDLTIAGSADGFYTLTFTLAALVASLLAENLFSPGPLCSLMSVSVCYLLTALGRLAAFLIRQQTGLSALLMTAVLEYLVTLPWLLLVYWLLRRVNLRTTIDY